MEQQTLLADWFVPPAVPDVPGLRYLTDWIDAATEHELLAQSAAMPWQGDWQRRVQVYGFGYGPDAAKVPPMPPWLVPLSARLVREGILERAAENAVINEYLPGQGIGAHRDYAPFGPTVVSLSLGAWCVMELRRSPSGDRHDLPLAPRSLVVLGGEARSLWTHAIPRRQSDRIQGVRVPRGRRVSVTFRTLVSPADDPREG